MRTSSAVISVVLTACAAPEPGAVNFQGAAYRLVTGKQLRTAFVGRKIRYLDPQRLGELVITSPRCDGFHRDGRYQTCGDRVPRLLGRYRVRQDRVCFTIHGPWRCYQLYRSPAGQYLLGHPGEQRSLESIDLVADADETVAPRMY